MWRCPHCGTPQAETARCWVCRRSSTACGTCRNFRRSVAGSLGYCGLDRRRQPLAGDEIRECWEARPSGADLTLAVGAAARIAAEEAIAAGRAAPLEFIEVHGRLASEPVAPSPEPAAPSVEPSVPSPDGPAFVPPAGPPAEPGWNLWGDLER
jgi:hypothetical protein